MRFAHLGAAVTAIACGCSVAAQARPASAVDPAGIPGALFLCGGGALPEGIWTAFAQAAGGDGARIVVIPTASARADDDDASSHYLTPWADRTTGSIVLLHTRDRAVADTQEFVAPLRDATAVWITGGNQSRLTEAYGGTKVEAAILDVMARGGIVGGTSAGAAVLSRVMIAGGKTEPRLATGFDGLPGAVVDQHFSQRQRSTRLAAATIAQPGHWGLGIDEATAVLVTGRRLQVLGEGAAHVHLPPGADREAQSFPWPAGHREDIVRWQRAAIDRTAAPFPPPTTSEAVAVPSGTVLAVGGGAVPRAILQRFLDAAGGVDAPLVVVPTAAGPNADRRPGFERMLQRAGCTNVSVLHAAHPSDLAGKDLSALEAARGVWFGGGRQWRLVDAYAHTPVLNLCHAVLARGGVVGGSSAGASILGSYMVRGNPMGNTDMMALGYERGFGFLAQTAVDQHFTQRRRLPDLQAVAARFPQLHCFGIDEATALVVDATQASVIGRGTVTLLRGSDAPKVFASGTAVAW